MLKFLKPLSFLPAILMMYLIFTFSSQDGVTSAQLSYKVSYKVIETGGELLGADFEPWEIDNLATRFHGAIRKIAHMTEYFALAVAVAFPLYVYGLRGILLMLVAGFFCVAFACGDEYHQSYVAGRGPSKRDVLIDSFGVFWGIVLVRIIGWTGRKTIFRPFTKKKKSKKAVEAEQRYPQQPYPQGAYSQPPYQQAPYPQPPYQRPPQQGPYPQQPYPQGTYQQGAYQQGPGVPPYQTRENVSYYPPKEDSDPSAAPSSSSYRQPGPGYYNQYGQAPYGYPPQQPIQQDTTSDRLSEDMSLKKLVHDLKDQKKNPHESTKKPL